jgi:hypothetical protein
MKSATRRFLPAMVLILFLVLIGVPFPAAADQEYSRARIVRLSFVEGTVTVLGPGSADWANAPVNTPIQEGFQLSTDKNSFAEVQFENGSTARVGELSLLKFEQLGLAESGDSLNRLRLDHGYGTFRVQPEKVQTFEVQSGDATFKPAGKAEFRIDLDQDQVRVEVFKGSLEVSSPEVSTTLAKNNVLEFTPGSEQAYSISHEIVRDDWDQWVAQRDEQEAENRPPGGYPQGAPAYGWSDLNNYGTWSYFDGYGYGWIPDVAGSWAPFTAGRWASYPGCGYTWISSEPWGWLPSYYGGWSFDPLFGWAWFPGTAFGSWCPANVTWYQGPGWVGWLPNGPATGPATKPRPPGPPRGCPDAPCRITAVNLRNFSQGGPIRPRALLPVDAFQGERVVAPNVEPGPLALLPGTPAKLSSAQRAIVSGEPLGSELAAKASPEGRHAAPSSTFTAPPAGLEREGRGFWASHSAHAPSAQSGSFGSPGSFGHSSESSPAASSSMGGSASHAAGSPHK